MEQGTNSQGAKFRPVSINYGAIIQNHIRYMRKYKDQQEAQKYSRKANEREFQRKLSNDREKLLPDIGVGDAQGYWRHERLKVFKNEEKELSNLKQEFKNTGSAESKIKYDNRRRYYQNLNKLTESSTAFLKYINENKKDYNEDRDKGLLNLAKTLQESNYEIVKSGVRIPAKDGILNMFNLSKEDTDKDGFVVISPEVLSEKFINSGRFSGKVDFDGIGTDIAKNTLLNSKDGNIERTPEKEAIATRSWKDRLLSDDNLAKSYASRKGVNLDNLNKDDLDVFLTNSSIELAKNLTFEKWKTVDNSLANNIKKQQNSRANFNTFSKDKQDLETISVITNESGTPIQSTKFAGDTFSVAFPKKGVQHGSPTSKGRVVYTSANILENGGIELTGFELEKGQVTDNDGNISTEFVTTSKRVNTTDKQVIGEVIKQIPDGKGKNTTFDNAEEFYNKSFSLFRDKSTDVGKDKNTFIPNNESNKKEVKKDAFGNVIED